MRIAISGAGIAGPTLAYWLLRHGHAPTLIEAAPKLRTGGYMIDFWGVGYDVADRMGILSKVREAGYQLQELRYVDGRGRRVASMGADALRGNLGERFISLPRGELAAILYGAVESDAEVLFATSIAAIEDHGAGVQLRLTDGTEREFDLVVGADGLHSAVRRLVFGPEVEFERALGYYVAAFETDGYRPRDELVYLAHGAPGRQIFRFALRGGRTMFLFVFAAEWLAGPEPSDAVERKEVIVRVFSDLKWEWPAIGEALGRAQDVYFDRVSQISLGAWSKGRAALVGDAAACVSLVAGEGVGLAMTEAYVLAGELAAAGDYASAFARYEARLRVFIDGKQDAARRFARSFTPRTRLGLWFRDQAVRLMAVPGLPSLLVGAQMNDDFGLPNYAAMDDSARLSFRPGEGSPT